VDGDRNNDARGALIELKGITRSYGRHTAVRALDLAVPAGQFVAIIGESGSGKTTTLKIVNRLLEPDAGDVLIEGRSARGLPDYALRRRIGYVFQRIGLFPHMTVRENVGITPQLLAWEPARIEARVLELLDLVTLPRDFADRYPAALSGGQRQRVGVARALAAAPAIMLMDEPFGALDPVTRDALGTEYRRLHDAMKLTTLMVTHDVLEALLLADRVVVMRGGQIAADGAPRDLLAAQADPAVRALLETPRRQALKIAALLAGDGARE
jgi:osmoprotectant transport system ATP-binding protein